MRFTRMDVVRVIAVAAILAAVIAAFTGPAKAQVMNDKSTGHLDELPMYPEDYPRRLDAINPAVESERGRWYSPKSLFHHGGAVKIPEGSNCESCH